MAARKRKWAWGSGIAALALLAGGPGALLAQDRAAPPVPSRTEPPRECRCADGSGDRDSRCVCIRLPDRSDFADLPGMGRRAVLGVNVRQDQPARYDREGVRLYGVDDDTPAGKAGFQEGDILTTVDGRSLLDALPERREEERLAQDGSLPVQRLLRILRKHEAGDSLTIEYLRGGARRTAAVVMERPRGLPSGAFGFGPGDPLPPIGLALGPEGAMIAGMRNACPSRGGPGDRGVAWLGRSCVAGVELLSMQPELAEYFGADGGVLVTDANPDNPLGLESGDVLLAVDGRAITGVDRALRVLRSYEGEEEVALRVLRKRQTMELKGRMSG